MNFILLTEITTSYDWFSYLRVSFIFSLNTSSQALILMARIPAITWFINEMRLSDASAERRRSDALAKDRLPKYGRRRKMNITPIKVCQPIK